MKRSLVRKSGGFWVAALLAAAVGAGCGGGRSADQPFEGALALVSAPAWKVGVTYAVGARVTFQSIQYECRQRHRAQTGWEPPRVPALWNAIPAGTAWAPQVSYARGAEVTYQGASYRCLQSHVSQPDWTPPAVPALWERLSAPAFTHRVDVFIMRDIEFCVSGDPCTTPDQEGCFKFYDGSGNVAAAFDGATLQTLEPDQPVPANGRCARGALTETELATIRAEVELFRTDVVTWTKGALNLNVVSHEPGPRRVAMGSFGTGFWLGPGSVDDFAFSDLTRATDFVLVFNAARDPATGASFDIGACGLTVGFEWGLAGAGFSWIASTCASNPLTIHHEWLHQVEDGLRRLSPFTDLYNDQYPPCGQGDPDPTRWFPLTHDWGIDPDFPGCGTDGFPRFEEHQLRVHWSPDKKLITNHCKDGEQNFGETAVDMGGRCL